jgi:hypothetical protein
MKRKNNILQISIGIISIGIIVLMSTFYYLHKNNFQTTNLQSPTPRPTLSLNIQGNPELSHVDEQIIFTDDINNYYLNVSTLPDITITDKDIWNIYEFNMYKKTGEYMSGARFGLSEPMDNPTNLSLKEFAIKHYNYQPGTQTGGWGPMVRSAIRNTTVGKKYSAINWTDESPSETGFYFNNYLFTFDNKIVFLRMVAWKKQTFDESTIILKNILKTFMNLREI